MDTKTYQKQLATEREHQQWFAKLCDKINSTDGKYLDSFPRTTQHFIKREEKKGVFSFTEEECRIIMRVKPLDVDTDAVKPLDEGCNSKV